MVGRLVVWLLVVWVVVVGSGVREQEGQGASEEEFEERVAAMASQVVEAAPEEREGVLDLLGQIGEPDESIGIGADEPDAVSQLFGDWQ